MLLYILIILLIIYIIYQVTIGIPSQLKKTDEKIEMLKLNFKEINIKLNEINQKLDSKSL